MLEFTSHQPLITVDKERNSARGWGKKKERTLQSELKKLDFSKLAVYWFTEGCHVANSSLVGKNNMLILSKVTTYTTSCLRMKDRPWHKYWWWRFSAVLMVLNGPLFVNIWYQRLLHDCWHIVCLNLRCNNFCPKPQLNEQLDQRTTWISLHKLFTSALLFQLPLPSEWN